MREQLQSILATARQLPPSELPRLLGELEEIRVTLLARLSAPAAPASPDRFLSVEKATMLDVEAAASYINMSAKWIYKHLDSVPHLRIGDGYKPRIRFRRRDLDHWLQEHSMDLK